MLKPKRKELIEKFSRKETAINESVEQEKKRLERI